MHRPYKYKAERSASACRATVNSLRGFTLVELLIVVAIIAALLSFIGVAAMSSIGTARITATKATITKVQGLLQQRVDAVGLLKPSPTEIGALLRDFTDKRRAEVMANKLNFRNAFPQTWAELVSTKRYVLPAGYPPTTINFATESGEVLYFILTQANVVGYSPEGTEAFSSSEIKDTDSPPNGVPELIDAWGKPLRFYRWPTRLIRGTAWAPGSFPLALSPQAKALINSLPTVASELGHDPDDRYGLLRAKLTATEISNFETGAGGFPRGRFHTMDTYWVPLIVSGGPDLITGLFEPSDISTTTFGYLAQPDPAAVSNVFDDISNHNIRSGGK